MTVRATVRSTARPTVGRLWTPASLFASGQMGAWYDPSDRSTLWQDTAGTVPVTAAGQSVARMNDKSGRSFHQLQATAASRPTYQVDADGRGYLAFDGTDDFMAVSGANVLGLPTAITAVVGMQRNSDVGGAWLLNGFQGAALAAGQRAWGLLFNVAATPGNLTAFMTDELIGSNNRGTAAVTASSVPYVAAWVLDRTQAQASEHRIRLNGVDQSPLTTFSANDSTGTFTDAGIMLGSQAGASAFCNMRLYGVVLRAGALSAADLAAAEAAMTWGF
jgi:hypothetical protein